jgi:hypothetical protein
VETESCRISHHVHSIEFRQIIRDAEIAYAISPVVRRHRLTEEETEKFLLELASGLAQTMCMQLLPNLSLNRTARRRRWRAARSQPVRLVR